MIYDYSTNPPNPPNVVTIYQANIDFPEFYFADEDLYFIYPANGDKIIYNFSLGVFFKFIRNGEYENIAIRPIITLVQMGNLIGYTQADPNQLPTLYYVNGRLTLQHANCRNIGWHPRKSGYTYVYGNILHPDNPKVFVRRSLFNQAEFNQATAEVNDLNFNQSRLIELYYNTTTNVIKSRHVSRSRLIPGPPPNFVLNIVNQFLAAKEMNPSPF